MRIKRSVNCCEVGIWPASCPRLGHSLFYYFWFQLIKDAPRTRYLDWSLVHCKGTATWMLYFLVIKVLSNIATKTEQDNIARVLRCPKLVCIRVSIDSRCDTNPTATLKTRTGSPQFSLTSFYRIYPFYSPSTIRRSVTSHLDFAENSMAMACGITLLKTTLERETARGTKSGTH